LNIRGCRQEQTMKTKIRILSENLCNKIAAGEVVERPASVVKELVENSLDAGATEIRVEVEGGGKKLIRVVDDGEGMGRDDAFLCLERHATSKIRSDEDLFRLQTLGFRGEALPSIAAVSRFALRSRPEETLEGWEIYAEGGTVKRAGAVGSPRGTTIEVRDLFFNTPARRKFLRRDETELGHVGDVVTKLALAHPEVQFRLVHNGRSLIDVYRQAQLRERVASLLGRPLLRDLVPLAVDGPEGLGLHGLVAQPALSRSTSGSAFTFINGRYIRDRVVQHALMEGYRNLLEKGRYPVAVLFLAIDPALVDVNVHPTKHEVRFRDQRLVHEFISRSIRETLRPSAWLSAAEEEPQGRDGNLLSAMDEPAALAPIASKPFADGPTGEHRQRVQEALSSYASTRPEEEPPAPVADFRRPAGPFVLPAREPQGGKGGFFSALEIIGQYRRSYILAQDGDDLILIDQHAAHERIAFERLRAQFRQGSVERQALLFPAVLELDFREAALLNEHLEELGRLGFDLEPFGGKTLALKAVPRLLSDADAERLVRDVAGEIATVGNSALVEEALDEVFAVMACHSVVRANQTLGPAQIGALLRELDHVDFKAHCPHGRPVMKRLCLAEVERMFKRS
jgi:DNA mismatch repair protein MutL